MAYQLKRSTRSPLEQFLLHGGSRATPGITLDREQLGTQLSEEDYDWALELDAPSVVTKDPYIVAVNQLIRQSEERTIARLSRKSDVTGERVVDAVGDRCDVLERQLRDITAKADTLAEQMKSLREENSRMSELMSATYTAKGLFMTSTGLLLACLGALIGALVYDVVILHPILAALGLVLSLGFAVLAVRRFLGERDSEAA